MQDLRVRTAMALWGHGAAYFAVEKVVANIPGELLQRTTFPISLLPLCRRFPAKKQENGTLPIFNPIQTPMVL